MAIRKNETGTAYVKRIMREYRGNSAEVLNAFNVSIQHIREDNQKTPMQEMAKAMIGTSDYSILTSMITVCTNGSLRIEASEKTGIVVKQAKKNSPVEWNEANIATIRMAIGKSVSFRNKDLLEKLGIRAGEAKPFDAEGAASSFVKRYLDDCRKKNETASEAAIVALIKAAFAAKVQSEVAGERVNKKGKVTTKTPAAKPTNALA